MTIANTNPIAPLSLQAKNRSQRRSKAIYRFSHRLRAGRCESHAEEHVIRLRGGLGGVLLGAEPAAFGRQHAAIDARVVDLVLDGQKALCRGGGMLVPQDLDPELERTQFVSATVFM